MLWPLSFSQMQTNALTEDFVIMFYGQNTETSERGESLRSFLSGNIQTMENQPPSQRKRCLTPEPFCFAWQKLHRLTLEEKAAAFPGHVSANKGNRSTLSGLTDTKIKAQFDQG